MRKIIIALLFLLPLFSFRKSEATLIPSCTVCNTYTVDFTGSGYKGRKDVMVHVFKDGQYVWGLYNYTQSASDGAIDFSFFFQWGAGNYRVEVYERRVQSRFDFMASVNIIIQ